MSFSITCPDCRTTLKASKAPRPDKMMQCLKCGHRFTLTDSEAITATPPPPPVIFPPQQTSGLPAILLTAVGFSVLAIAGFFGAYFANRNERPAADVKPAEVIAKTEPQEPEPKSAAQPEPKAASKDDLELEQRREKFSYFMIDGGIASQLRKYDEAVSAYTEAAKLFPDHPEAERKLADAKTAFESQEKARRELEQVQTETAALIKRGQSSLDKDQFAAAIDFFKLALEKSPTSEEAADKLSQAQDRLQKINAEKKKLDDFDRHILTGKASLKGGRAADAVREFVAAGRILPTDPLPPELLKEAEAQLAKENNQGDRKRQYQAFLDLAGNYIRDKNLEDADDAYRQALKLFPNDLVATRGLEDLQKKQKKANADVANLMKQAQNSLAQGQLAAAMTYLRDAERIMPNNPDLARALSAAQLIQANQTSYFQAINRATAAMITHRYGDALVAYSDALRIAPNDPQATVGFVQAQRNLEIFNRKKVDYDILVNQGVQAIRTQRYLDAAKSLESAVRLMRPLLVDPQVVGLSRYADAMAQGTAALNSRQFPQAAQFFLLALNQLPNDPAAQLGLQKARLSGKG